MFDSIEFWVVLVLMLLVGGFFLIPRIVGRTGGGGCESEFLETPVEFPSKRLQQDRHERKRSPSADTTRAAIIDVIVETVPEGTTEDGRIDRVEVTEHKSTRDGGGFETGFSTDTASSTTSGGGDSF